MYVVVMCTYTCFKNNNILACIFIFISKDLWVRHYIVSSTSEPTTSMKKLDIEYLSHKLKRKEKKKNRSSDGENHYVVVLEPKKVKRKDVSKPLRGT